MDALLEPGPTFQAQLDAARPGAVLRLLPVEYAGPVVIRRPVTIEGQGATFWALKGPALAVDADRVRLLHLRVEHTGGCDPQSEDGCALLIGASRQVEFDGVTVRGGVRGLAGEDGIWRLPDVLHAGRLEPGEEHVLTVRLYVPMRCRLESGVAGLEVEPAELAPGANEIRLILESLPPDTLLHGALTIHTRSLKRSVPFVAHLLNAVAEEGPREPVLWQPTDWEDLVGAGSPVEETTPRLPIPPLPELTPMVASLPVLTQPGSPPPTTPVIPGAAPAATPPPTIPALPSPAAVRSPVLSPITSPPVISPPASGSTPIRKQGPRRTISGPLVSNVFDSPPASTPASPPAEPAAQPEAAPAQPAPADTAPPRRPPFKLKPLSRLFDQGAGSTPATPPNPAGDEPPAEKT